MMFKSIQKLSDAYPKLWSSAKYVVVAVVGFVGAEAKNIILDQRTTRRDALKESAQQSFDASVELAGLLQKFSLKALGKGQTSDEDVKSLRAAIWKLNGIATQASDRSASLRDGLSAYSASLVRLQKAAESLRGPADGKPFVEAVSSYLVAQRDFNSQVISAASSWSIF